MTDSEKFTLLERTKKDIKKMGFEIEIFHNRQIQIGSAHFSVIWELIDNVVTFEVINNEVESTMLFEEWEDFSAEVDNLNRAILWVNTQIKSIVFE